jgi:hypothetical protein
MWNEDEELLRNEATCIEIAHDPSFTGIWTQLNESLSQHKRKKDLEMYNLKYMY